MEHKLLTTVLISNQGRWRVFKNNKIVFALTLMALFAANAHAEIGYPDILKSLTANKKNVVSEVPETNALNRADNLEQARLILNKLSYANLNNTESASLNQNQIFNLIKQRQITFVVVPGVLGEFIDTRAFEEIFSRNSSFKQQWKKISDNAGATDTRFNLEKIAQQNEKLSDLINAASVDDSKGQPFFKLIILKTPMGSLESVGSNVGKAQIFNKRLEQYFELTQDKNIVLLGYSRGTPLALEMVVQAEKNRLNYLNNVKAVVSYAGVVMGSSLADVTDDSRTESGRLLIAAKKLQNDLQYSRTLFDRPTKFAENSATVAKFLYALNANSKFDPDAFLSNARSGDFKTVAALIAKMTAELSITTLYDFNGHVARIKLFIGEVIKAVEGLKTKSMLSWWQSNSLPKKIQYLSLAAAMVDPAKNALEKSIFDSNNGYIDSLDDKSLLENKRAYEKLTGVALNDSQVAVHQSLFLPAVISNLNSANSDLSIKTLGLLETHHWGVSLQVVNKMKDGRLNPFPREKVLLALAAYLNQ